MPEGCAADFGTSDFGLARAPRVGEYRGFVFASLAANGPSFEDHIGPMKSNIDDLVDRAPDGELAFDLGMHRYVFDGNWKLQIENVLDSYHVPFGHASTVNKEGVQFARREGDKQGAKVVEAEKKSTASPGRTARSYIVGNGHGWTSNTTLDDGKRSSPAFDEYKRALIAKVGAERANEILTPRLHNSLIYPNMSIMGLNIHVRVIKPIAVDRTEVNVYPVRLVGAPDAMNFGNIRLLNVTHSAASFVQTDDHRGLRARAEGPARRGDRMGRYLARPRRRGARPRAQRDARPRRPMRWWCAPSTRRGSATCARRPDGRRSPRAAGHGRRREHRPRRRSRRSSMHEARLLDERRFRDWMDLFADDGTYWVPAAPTRRARSTKPRCSMTTAI